MSINDALRLRAKNIKSYIGLCHECCRSGVLVKPHRTMGTTLCAECGDAAGRRLA